MSTVKVDTIQTTGGVSEIAIDKLKGVSAASSISVVAEGGTTTTNLQQGLAKAWVNSNQATVDDSFNNASVTDSDVGRLVANLTNAMSNTGYAVSVCARVPVSQTAEFYENNNVTRTTSATAVVTLTAGSYYDSTDTMTVHLGDLA